MSAAALVLLLVFALGASFTQRVTGFGFGIFIMTVLPFLMPSYGEATALSGMLAVISVTITLSRMWRYIQWRKLLPILVAFLLVSFFSVRLVARVDSNLMKRVLGCILVVVSVYFFFFSSKVRIEPTFGVQVGMGTLSGLMGGLFAMQGPPAVIYFLSCTDTKEQYISLISAYFVIGNLMMTAFRAMSGFVTPFVCKAWLAAFPAVLAGLWLGGRVYSRMPIETIRKAAYLSMAVSGVVALVR